LAVYSYRTHFSIVEKSDQSSYASHHEKLWVLLLKAKYPIANQSHNTEGGVEIVVDSWAAGEVRADAEATSARRHGEGDIDSRLQNANEAAISESYRHSCLHAHFRHRTTRPVGYCFPFTGKGSMS
jgi:hypothetical protein